MTDGPDSTLAHVPISLFTIPMGVFGLSLALTAGGFAGPGGVVGGLGALLLAVLFATLVLKALRHPAALKAEWSHPIKLAFFPATSISVLLVSTWLLPLSPEVARPLWLIGAAAQGVLTLVVISSWIGHRAFGPGHLSPAWFIPAVGNLMAPLAGQALGYVTLSWYFFAVGLLFWIILLTLVFNRLIFHDPLPGKLQPTLVILIAPPALAFLGWVGFNGGTLDATAHLMINAGFFFTALVVLQLPRLLRLPFALSFWALSFPVAAMSVACFRYAALADTSVPLAVGYVLLTALAGAIAILTVLTTRAALSGALFVPD